MKLLARDSEPSGILPSDHRVLCDCGSDQPMASVVQLRDYALRGGKLVSEITGERVCCQSCGNTFSIGRHGRFRHHPQALPLTPAGAPRPAPPMDLPNRIEPGPKPPLGETLLPKPLPRPTV